MKWYGSVDNRLMETIRPEKPQVGQFATTISYSDRGVELIVEVSKDGKTFKTIDVERITKNSPEYFREVYTTAPDGTKLVSIYADYYGKGEELRVNNAILLEHPNEKEFTIFYRPENKVESQMSEWKLISDGKYHRVTTTYDGKKRTKKSNQIIIPNLYDYYYDMSF